MLESAVSGKQTNKHNATQVNPIRLTFSAATWRTPQPVAVRVDDNAVDQGQAYALRVSHIVQSSDDPNYDGIGAAQVLVTVTDNDAAAIETSVGSVEAAEGGGGVSYQIRLASEPRQVRACVRAVVVAVAVALAGFLRALPHSRRARSLARSLTPHRTAAAAAAAAFPATQTEHRGRGVGRGVSRAGGPPDRGAGGGLQPPDWLQPLVRKEAGQDSDLGTDSSNPDRMPRRRSKAMFAGCWTDGARRPQELELLARRAD
eukprot:SAG22_NODE_106_length_19904_cov_14.387175_1_plen_259_part_00